MKRLFHFALFLLFAGYLGQSKAQVPDVLVNIQDRVDQAFNASFQAGPSELESIIQNLEEAQSQGAHSYLAYWQAYACYYQAIYYMKSEDTRAEAQAANQKGLALLENLKDKNSEEHALLADLYSLSMSFNPDQVITIAGKRDKHIAKALQLDENNLRAYLSQGKSDFYTPVQYGGGKKVEKSLLKALSLPNTTQEEPYAPSWGRSQAYSYLVQYYLREGLQDKALIYCKQGLQKFPDDYSLNEHLKKLEQ